VYAQITDAALFSSGQEPDRYEELKNNFDTIFGNRVYLGEGTSVGAVDYTTFIEKAYDIKEEIPGKYDVDVKIPLFNIESEVLEQENERIKGTYVNKLIDIVKNSERHTIYSINYVAYVNNNILSLVIKCTLKDPNNPQRIMIETINYDMDNDKILTLEEIINIKDLKKEEVQNKINSEIKTVAAQMEAISSEEYQFYKRNPDDQMYNIENTKEFFLGESNILYIVYPYGNKDFTSQKDIILY